MKNPWSIESMIEIKSRIDKHQRRETPFKRNFYISKIMKVKSSSKFLNYSSN